MAGVNATNIQVLSWYPADPLAGIIFLLLGFAGALVTVYFYIGGFLPSMGNSVRIKELQVDESQLKARISELRGLWDKGLKELGKMNETYDNNNSTVVEKKIEAKKAELGSIENRITKMEADLISKQQLISAERASMIKTGTLLYVLLGGAIAAIIAKDFLQAIVIGAGWTTFASTLGLKKKEEQSQERRDEEWQKQNEAQVKLDKIISEYEGKISEAKTATSNKVDEAYKRGLADGIVSANNVNKRPPPSSP